MILSFIVLISFVRAENLDYSSYDGQNNFLLPQIGNKETFLSSDFIFPLANYNKENVDKFVSKANKKTWTYVVKKGDTLLSISKKFKVPLNDILVFNDLKENSIIKAGDKLVIPGVKPQATIGVAQIKEFAGKFVSALKEIGNFVIPTTGFNWGQKHSFNGTDIAAPCGTEVFAANAGEVVESRDGWNSGYGNYIIIRHKDGSYTLYGHLQMRVVEIGDYVEKGELIGYVGNTGYTIGPTGCHLHFEVRGSANPLLK